MKDQAPKLNKAQLSGILRTLLGAVSGYMYAKGVNLAPFLTPEVIDALASTLLLIVGYWSVKSNRDETQPKRNKRHEQR